MFGTAAAAAYFAWELVALSKPELKQLPKPAKGCRPPTHRFEFARDEARLRADEQYDGYNAIVTTVPPARASADTLFTRFKQQAYREQVNSQFKGPLAVRPVFRHSPRRIESLMFLLVISLMTHYLIQRTRHGRTISPTRLNTRQQEILRRLNTRQQEILRRLELPTPAQLLSRLLPRPPD